MFAKTARAWATTSSPPTSRRSRSTGTTPLTKSSSPACTASVKWEMGSAWPATLNSRRLDMPEASVGGAARDVGFSRVHLT